MPGLVQCGLQHNCTSYLHNCSSYSVNDSSCPWYVKMKGLYYPNMQALKCLMSIFSLHLIFFKLFKRICKTFDGNHKLYTVKYHLQFKPKACYWFLAKWKPERKWTTFSLTTKSIFLYIFVVNCGNIVIKMLFIIFNFHVSNSQTFSTGVIFHSALKWENT